MANKKQKTLVLITLIPIVMFGFGFALVPLYDVFCRITGLNGKVNTSPAVSTQTTELEKSEDLPSREVRVQFVTQNNASMPWDFSAVEADQVAVNTGDNKQVFFRVTNTTNELMRGRAVPSVSPSEAAQYFHKVQCFCFDQQELKAGETLDMGVVFVVDKKLPEHIHTITLAYTLFDVSLMAANN